MRSWSRRFEFWKAMPASSYAMVLAGVFLIFLPMGLLNDIGRLGQIPPARLVASMIFNGGIAVAYVVVVRWPIWVPVLFAAHMFVVYQLFGETHTPPLAAEALRARLRGDIRWS
jgi:hypothetical protein